MPSEQQWQINGFTSVKYPSSLVSFVMKHHIEFVKRSELCRVCWCHCKGFLRFPLTLCADTQCSFTRNSSSAVCLSALLQAPQSHHNISLHKCCIIIRQCSEFPVNTCSLFSVLIPYQMHWSCCTFTDLGWLSGEQWKAMCVSLCLSHPVCLASEVVQRGSCMWVCVAWD